MSYKILDDKASLESLVRRMPTDEREAYERLKHIRSETIFLDRVFYVYKCTGKGSNGLQLPPQVLANVRVINFGYVHDKGFLVSLLNEDTNEKQVLDGTPAKIFGYDVYANVPCSFSLKHNEIVFDDGRANFDTSVVIYVKTSNKADFYSKGTTYMETPPRMAALYPLQEWAPDRT